MEQNVKVAVRCRPMSAKEVTRGCKNIISINNNSVTVSPIDSTHESKSFTYDYCYNCDSIQSKVYEDLGKPMVTQALDGFNGTIFAYGQTGSGKTFSMMGTDEIKGVIPNLNEDLFERLNEKMKMIEANTDGNVNTNTKCMVTVSFLEVYNEEIKDLLNPSDKKLKIHENPKQGIYVDGLAELIVRDASDLLRLIYQGNAVRRVAATKMNDQSSRSHSVFTIKLEQKTSTLLDTGVSKESLIKAKLNLVDLAGSERAGKTGATGQTLKEGANINLSLMALGNVINMLSEGAGRKGHKKVIPYRDSKLTRLLQESLGGNSATIMLAAISPADYNYSETLSTLKYANRAKSIANEVSRNEDNNERMIKELQKQIEELKKKLESGGTATGNVMTDPEIEKKLKEMQETQASAWEEKERLSKALEEERQANMNTVISEMMSDVKQQKVLHMKNIKRLTNEKALLSKNFKEFKEYNIVLKKGLDGNIQRYQSLQKQYDDAAVAANNEEFKEGVNPTEEELQAQQAKQEQAEQMANEMIALLTKIEEDRQKYTEKRDALKRMRARLDTIDDEITDERAELVATAGLLSQNDKLREQIQQEEREKMKIEFNIEIEKAKKKLDEERQNVRETISSEIQQQMDQLTSEVNLVKNLLKVEENKNAELTQRHQQLQEYSDDLEQRLADSEVAYEEVQVQTEQLVAEKDSLKQTITAITSERDAMEQQLQHTRQEALQAMEGNKNEYLKLIEEAKFDMFKTLMDKFEEERSVLEKTHQQTQTLLSQAAKDVIYLTQKNNELQAALNAAIYYEPTIKPNYHGNNKR